MKWLYIALFSLFASSALATVDGWPALYDVTDVAADDALNVREGPSADAIVVSSFPPNASNIEVIAINDAETWGLVNIDGRSGWVSMRFMARQPGQYAGTFPDITFCHGTEPFWSLEVEEDTLTFNALGQADSVEPVTRLRSANRIDRFALSTPSVTGMVLEQSCRDGMSDFTFGLAIEMIAPLYGNTTLVSGCCTIQP